MVELEVDSSKSLENGEGARSVAPQEAYSKISEVVKEAIRKMEMVGDEKMRVFKKARMAVDSCDRELENKAKEVAELKLEKQKKRLQIEELEKIVRLKQAEADMFQKKADEAKQEAEKLRRIALARLEKSEDEYASNYLKHRLSEAEAEKQHLFEKMKQQESSRSSSKGDPSQARLFSKIDELINGYNMLKTDTQSNGHRSLRPNT